MSLQLPQLKQSVIETGQSQGFQDSLSREHPALVHSVLRAQSPICSFSPFCCLLVLTALTSVSNIALHRCTPLAPHYADPQLQSTSALLSLHKHSATQYVCCLAVTRLSICCYPLNLHNAYCTSQTFFALPVSDAHH